jgi:hypothetical protein
LSGDIVEEHVLGVSDNSIHAGSPQLTIFLQPLLPLLGFLLVPVLAVLLVQPLEGLKALGLLLDEEGVEGRVVLEHFSVICIDELGEGPKGLEVELGRLGTLDHLGSQRLDAPLIAGVLLDQSEEVGEVSSAKMHDLDELIDQ